MGKSGRTRQLSTRHFRFLHPNSSFEVEILHSLLKDISLAELQAKGFWKTLEAGPQCACAKLVNLKGLLSKLLPTKYGITREVKEVQKWFAPKSNEDSMGKHISIKTGSLPEPEVRLLRSSKSGNFSSLLWLNQKR